MDFNEILKKITEKKSLSGLSEEIVSKELKLYLKKDNINLNLISQKDSKIIVRDMRAKLRKLSGSFNSESFSDQEDILSSHSSTRERKEFYQNLKNKLFDLKVKSILDLGCGLNPLALAEKGMEYHAYDINADNLKQVETFFKNNGISGEVKVVDLRETTVFPEVDLTILFKVLDLLDEKNHKPSEALLKSLKSKHLLISFSTKTLSGAPMRHPQRGWIELLLKRLGYDFESFSSKNEIFYLAKKSMSSS